MAGIGVPATEYAGVQRSDTAVRDAFERTTADARSAVRETVADASVAASNPVMTPANNEWGDLLDPETAFRDAIRARIYIAAHE